MQNSTQFDPPNQSSLIDPRTYGLIKASYSINEVLDVLSIGRTSLYYAIKRGDLRPAKLGKKTLLLASDLAKFLSTLQLAASSDRVDTADPRGQFGAASRPTEAHKAGAGVSASGGT
jgi:hypothetical protein